MIKTTENQKDVRTVLFEKEITSREFPLTPFYFFGLSLLIDFR